MKLSVVIVNYRTPGLVLDAVSSLLDDETLPDGTRILVVDGASGDDSVPRFEAAILDRAWFDRVELLPLTVNGGFAYANNRGIEHLRAGGRPSEYTLLLNPDTYVRTGAARTLVNFLDAHPRAGIAGSRLEDPDGTLQSCAFRFPNPLGEFESEVRFGPASRILKRFTNVQPTGDAPERVGWVSGASFMVRQAMLAEIGLMSEDYFLYYEEVDFCLRAARAGWECWHVPESRVVHLVGQSTNVTRRTSKPVRRPRYWFESRRHYFMSNHGRTYAVLADLAWLSGFGLRRVRRPLRRGADDVPPHLFKDFLRHSALRASAEGRGSRGD